MFKRIIALICTLAICFSLVVFPAFAEDYTSSAVSYWDAIVIGLRDGTTSGLNFFYDGLGDVAGKVVSNLSSNLCGSSDDGLHHADHLSDQGGKDSNGQYVDAMCKFCGDTFRCYGADISDAYDDYVKTNSGGAGSFGVTSTGVYKVYPECLGALSYHRFNNNDLSGKNLSGSSVLRWWLDGSISSPNTLEIVPFSASYFDDTDDFYLGAYYPLYQITFPFSCTAVFRLSGGGRVQYWYGSKQSDGTILYSSNQINQNYNTNLRGLEFSLGSSLSCYDSGRSFSYSAGDSESILIYPLSPYYNSGRSLCAWSAASGSHPYVKDATWTYSDLEFYLELTPYAGSVVPSSSSRPSTIIKNVYNISNNTTINNMFDESNNTYIDASTGDTYNVTNWEYNYASRFYSFTYDADDVQHTVVITYADDFVVVTDNGTTSYYYYGFDDGGGSGGGGSSGGDSSGDSSGGGSGGGSSIDYIPVINDIIAKLQTLIEQGDANSEYLKKVMDALDSINSNTKDTYLTLLDLLNRVNTGLSYTDESGKTYSVSELAYYIYAYLKDNLDEKVSGISALLDKILKAIESISPNIDIDIDVDGDGQKDDTDTWFNGFLGKFAFVGTLYDCAKQLVADITNDAASAQAVNAGDIAVQDLTAEHAVQAASDGGGTITTYTSPEVLLNFPAVSWHGIDFSRMSALDLSWYAPYKPTVDNIVSGFLWLGFLWLLIKRAPGIIQGSAMAESDAIKIQDFRR